MPSKLVNELLEEVQALREALNTHLIESGGIKAQLKINTWLTGVILVGLIAVFLKR